VDADQGQLTQRAVGCRAAPNLAVRCDDDPGRGRFRSGMPSAIKRPAPSIWGPALDHLAQARKSSWTRGAATGAAWGAVHIGEKALLAAAPSPVLVGEKLCYLLAVTQVPEIMALRQREQPWHHRLPRSAIEDVACLAATSGGRALM